MEECKCPNCGSTKPPIEKAIFNTKDKVIAVILFIGFFPLGIGFILIKLFTNKEKICPDCKMSYSGAQSTSATEDIAKIKNVVTTVATDPNVKKVIKSSARELKELKNSAKSVQDSFYVN